MKKCLSAACVISAILMLGSCGGTKTAQSVTPTAQEFDVASSSWKPLGKVVVPPPHEEGAVIVEQKKPGMIDKIGKTMGNTVKAPLKWVGLAKDDEPAPAQPAAGTAPAKTTEAKPTEQ